MAHEAKASGALGVYKPRRPQASPLFRLVQDHFRRLETVYDERFAPTYGEWRPVVREVADKFLPCGIGRGNACLIGPSTGTQVMVESPQIHATATSGTLTGTITIIYTDFTRVGNFHIPNGTKTVVYGFSAHR